MPGSGSFTRESSLVVRLRKCLLAQLTDTGLDFCRGCLRLYLQDNEFRQPVAHCYRNDIETFGYKF